jgi:STE24 endopeptidase
MVLAVAAAEGGVRLLRPRERPIEPARIDLHSYFSDDEIARGARFARPQLALGLTRAAIDAGALALVVRRPPPVLTRRFKRPALGGAAAGASLAVALSLPTLPLRAIARKRGMKVGLVTQSWRGWAADLAKGGAIEAVLAAGAAALLSLAQRRLSTPARELRRRTVWLSGEQRLSDGTTRELTSARLAAPLDAALKATSAALVLLAVALVAIRL